MASRFGGIAVEDAPTSRFGGLLIDDTKVDDPTPGPITDDTTSTLGGTVRDPVGTEFAKRTAKRFADRASTIEEYANRQDPTTPGFVAIPFVAAGQTAATLSETFGDALFTSAKRVIPDGIKDTLKEGINYIAQTDVGQAGLTALQNGVDKWKEFEKEHPETAIEIGSAFGLAEATSIGGVTSVTKKEAIKTARDAAVLIGNKLPKTLDAKELVAFNLRDVAKTLKPTKRSLQGGTINKYRDDLLNATKAIQENKANLVFKADLEEDIVGQVPRNYKEFAEAIPQTKREIYKKYDDLASTINDDSFKIDYSKDLVENLRKAKSGFRIGDPTYNQLNARIKQYEATFKDRGPVTLQQAQKILQDLNSDLQSAHKRGFLPQTGKAFVDNLDAQYWRNKIPEVIDRAGDSGKEYKRLKNQYAALKKVEEDVTRQYMRELKIDESKIDSIFSTYSDAQLAAGIATQNIGRIVVAGVQKIQPFISKVINDPNKKIAKFFDTVDETNTIRQRIDTPESLIGKKIKAAQEAANLGKKDEVEFPNFRTNVNFAEDVAI